ncbi:integrase core domain-containing protein [Nocardia gipuzkoensis]|uniref:integrase core domain-containing protein n=1 Tax=Nocardia gipuzkoensis TaxID=2749991 RepID=UPI003F6A4591
MCRVLQITEASDWKDEYNHHRRHSALGYQTPRDARCCLHPPITGSLPRWTESRGPVMVSPIAS